MTRYRPAAAFAVGLLLVAGCSTGEQPRPSTPEEEPPSSALVTWSDTVCANVKVVDELRSYKDSTYYAVQVRSDVDSVLSEFDTLKPSGVERADNYLTELVRRLRQIRDQLSGDDTSARPRQRRVAALVDRLGKQQPKLTRLAGRARALAPSYHLAPNCSPLKPAPELSTNATRELVQWADTMCDGLASIDELPEPGDKLLDDPRFAPFEDSELSSYLTSVPSQVTSIREPLAKLPASGNGDADAYRSTLLKGLRNAEKQLPHDVSTLDLYDLPIERLRERAQRAADAIAGVKPQGPDLSAVAREHPALSAAYDLAPRCEPARATPSTSKADPLPPARNGTNLGACQDGKCQIEVSAPVDVTVRGNVFTVAVSEGTLWIASGGSSLIRLAGQAGEARFGVGGIMVVFSIAGSTDTAAVLDVSVASGG